MAQSTDIEKNASGAAVRSVSPDSIVPQPSPPLAGTPQVERQPPKPLSSPETGHELHDLSKIYPKLWKEFEEFEASVGAEMEHATWQGFDIVQGILLKNVMEARIKLMQHGIHFSRRESSEDYRVPVDPTAIEADVNRHCESVMSTKIPTLYELLI
jgi:hypothetical protein